MWRGRPGPALCQNRANFDGDRDRPLLSVQVRWRSIAGSLDRQKEPQGHGQLCKVVSAHYQNDMVVRFPQPTRIVRNQGQRSPSIGRGLDLASVRRIQA